MKPCKRVFLLNRPDARDHLVAIEPAHLACLTLPELERIIVLDIDTDNHSVHAGIGDRPLNRYLAYY